MSHSPTRVPTTVALLDCDPSGRGPLQARLADDPWSLSHAERLDLRAELGSDQARWLRRISTLVEPPALDDSFPAYLLATLPFAYLADAIGEARTRADLDTGTADQLQRFVDHYRGYLTLHAGR